MSDLDTLLAAEGLPVDYRQSVSDIIRPLAAHFAAQAATARQPVVVGINGCQGSGKTTLARFLRHILESEHGLRCAAFSIDDLYHSPATRQQLAGEVHPLFITRGPPGTHDVDLGHGVLDALSQGGSTRIPAFDKATDDRWPVEHWARFDGRPALIFFEGWCVGCPPQSAAQLVDPVNALERKEDPQGIWRSYANRQLAGPYRELFDRIDTLLMLKAPAFECVFDWRWQQEQQLAADPSRRSADRAQLMDRHGLRRFIAHYERLTRHMLDVLPDLADDLIPLAADHRMLRWERRS